MTKPGLATTRQLWRLNKEGRLLLLDEGDEREPIRHPQSVSTRS